MNIEDLGKGIGFVVTNNDVVEYIEEKYRLGVHSLYIAQVRGKFVIKMARKPLKG